MFEGRTVAMGEAALHVESITKIYPGVVALKDVSVWFDTGEVHAIIGENGAGKSTLLKIISGAIEPTSGTIHIDDKVFSKLNPKLAKDLGINIIYQEFNLVPFLSIYENMFLGRELGGLFLDKKEMISKTKATLNRFGIDLDPLARVDSLSVAHMQLVEIAKAIMYDAKILIMDEPTAPLTSNEVEFLFSIIRKLKEQNVAILYISHRFEEIFVISDRVSVFRDGEFINTHLIGETNRQELIREMVGRSLNEKYPEREHGHGDVSIQVENLSRFGKLDNISFQAREGEVLGIGGLVGAGRTELLRAIFGADRVDSGEVWIKGKKVDISKPTAAINLGIGLIPEDRKSDGLILVGSVNDNISLPSILSWSRFGWLQKKLEKKRVAEQIDYLSVKTPSTAQRVHNLSGGNQQKIVLAKWLATKCDILLFDEPTRGIDVATKQEIYKLINSLSQQNKTIIVVSSEIPELMGICDRVLIMYNGRICGELQSDEFDQEIILDYASGGRTSS